jgi:uncharacterized damage-inducible protein DinB
MTKSASPPLPLPEGLLLAFNTNERINQYLLENLNPAAWSVDSPGKVRSIPAIVAHMHNVRLMWLKATAKDSKIPDSLDKQSVTIPHARKAFEQSRAALEAVIKASLSGDGRVKGFRPDVAGFVGYLIAHDAHHRGQISMLAHQAGHPLSQSAMFGMWEWGSRAKECARDF